jgi:hypothetical protein
MDNLAADKTPAIRRWARRGNAGLCFTPANASWANPVQAPSGPVRTFVSRERARIRSERQQRRGRPEPEAA